MSDGSFEKADAGNLADLLKLSTETEAPGDESLPATPAPRIPEPFAAALANHKPREVCDVPAKSAAELYGRALARLLVGREDDARSDFQSAGAELGDWCRIELAYLDIRQRSAVKDALVSARLIADRAAVDSPLKARALHITGLAEGKMRNTTAAINALLQSREIYGKLNDTAGSAQVYDTLGMLEAARGRLDYALHCYALSLVSKTLVNDRYGMAITLGNLGRVHLRAGRFYDAIDCFNRDLALAEELADQRGVARMRQDLGRAHLGLEDFGRAEAELRKCLELAGAKGFSDLEFFAQKDLALNFLAMHKPREAAAALERAEKLLPAAGEPYLKLTLAAVRGELLLETGDVSAIEVLKQAAEGFAGNVLPDLEIPALISLAKAYHNRKMDRLAEDAILRGLRIARADGYARFLPMLNQVMASLELSEGAIEEQGRKVSDHAAAPTNYLLRQKLGGGAFGGVSRVYDPQRGVDVALKQLKLDRLYNPKDRNRLIYSARTELEAASRLRHPGVVRVLGIGTEEDGGFYVVQEFIAGRSLGEIMPEDNSADVVQVTLSIGLIASALAALHEAGIVHRDLKPENILMRDDGQPVLVDFGIAQVHEFTPEAKGQIMGTAAYMAPEQAAGAKVDARADLYALGVIYYQWLTGTLPIHPRGATLDEVFDDLARRAPAPIGDFRRDLPTELERFIMSLLAKKPRHRPGSAMEVVEFCDQMSAKLAT